MRREWELEDLLDFWTLDEQELALLANKSGATRLGFGLMLKYFELEARFPRREDIPRAAVEFMAGQVKVDAALFAFYDFTSRTAVNHRAQIREYHQFQGPTVGDEDKLIVWLASDICPTEISRERLRTALLTRCREDRIEPPTPGRIERLLGAAESMFERQFTETTLDRLNPESIEKLEELIVADDLGSDEEDEADKGEAGSSAERAEEEDDDTDSGAKDEGDKSGKSGGGQAFLQELKQNPGPLQLDTLLAEIVKLERVKAIGLPEGLFEGVSEKIVAGWRARAMKMYPSDIEAAPERVRITLLAALCWARKAEMIDGLLELLIQLVHKISVRAEKKVENEIAGEFRRVHGNVDPGDVPVFEMSKEARDAGKPMDEVVDHIAAALNPQANALTQPPLLKNGVRQPKNIPGNADAARNTPAGTVLTRTRDTDLKKANRETFGATVTIDGVRHPDGLCQAYFQYPGYTSYKQTGRQCDEYPFASTRPGASKANGHYSIRAVDGTQNRNHGFIWLNQFYSRNRVVNEHDPFLVRIMPE